MANDTTKRDANNVWNLLGIDSSTGELRAIKVTPDGSLVTSGTTTITPTSGALTDRSGTITAGGTAQNAIAVNSSRKYLLLRNPVSASEPLWFSLVGTATTASPSIRLNPGDAFVMEGTFVATNAVSVLAATTAHSFTCWEG